MLPLGKIAARYNPDKERFKKINRYCHLTRDEQRTLMALWANFRSQLMMGGTCPKTTNEPLRDSTTAR